MYLFLWSWTFYRTKSLLTPSVHCLSMTCKKNGRKRRLLSEFWLPLHAKDDWRKIPKFDNQLTFEPQKVPTHNFTTINHKPSPVCCKHGLRKGKRKRTLLLFPAMAASTYLCLSWWIFCWLLQTAFVALNDDQFLAGTRYCTWYCTSQVWYGCLVQGTW